MCTFKNWFDNSRTGQSFKNGYGLDTYDLKDAFEAGYNLGLQYAAILIEAKAINKNMGVGTLINNALTDAATSIKKEML